MIDAWNIGVELTLNDQIFSGLDKVDDALGRIQSATDSINNNLIKMGTTLAAAAGSARGLASAFATAATDAERIQRAAGGFGGGSGGRGGGGNGGGDGYPALPSPSSRGGALTPYTNWRPYEPDASWDDGSTGRAVPLYQKPPGGGGGGNGFSPMDAMSSVFIAQAATGMIASAVKGAVSPSFDIQDQLTNIRNMTPGGGNVSQIQSQAYAAAVQIQKQFPGMTIGQALAMISNLYSVDRNMGAVVSMAPGYAQAGYVMSAAQGGADANDELYSILRSSEDLGKLNILNKDGSINTTKAMSFIDMYGRLVANSNGNLSGAGALTMIGQAGPGATQMDDTALARMIIASQALGPSQVGTGINAMYQEFIGGKMSQATARALHDAGVLPDFMFGKDDKILKQYRYGIGQVMLPTGTLKDEAGALADPIAWASKNLFSKYLNADGSVPSNNEKAVEGLIADLNKDFSRIPGMKLAGNAIFNSVVQSRQMANAASLASLGQLAANDASTPNANAAGTGAAFNAFLAAMGSPLIPGATKGLQLFTASLNDLSDAARNHPDVTKGADQGLFAALAVGGGAAVAYGLKKIGIGATGDAAFAGGEGFDPLGGGFIGLMALAIGEAIVKYSGAGAGGTPRNPHAPSGAPSDPLHVVVKGGPDSTPMPTGPTGFNPQETPPVPGRPMLGPR